MIERIKQLIALSGATDASFAKKINVAQGTLWRQMNGTRKMSLETVMAILEAYPDVDSNWLLRGTGDMMLVNNSNDKRMDSLVDVIAMQQETIQNLLEKIKQLKNQ